MKTQQRLEKFNWLQKHIGYRITADGGAGWNAGHPSLSQLQFTDNSLGLIVGDDVCQIHGWLSLPLDLFKGVMIALLQIPADFNFNKMEHIHEHYTAQFYNDEMNNSYEQRNNPPTHY